ncbi:MAG: hypothetical protein IPN29_14235 [Saprospiraceae bacterium]|nr:hypothetical protein [Saprospiraceae bacterium]
MLIYFYGGEIEKSVWLFLATFRMILQNNAGFRVHKRFLSKFDEWNGALY